MAVFGLPGGAEWAVIALALVFLFVPGALVFWLGFLTGRGAASRRTDASAATSAGAAEPTTQAAPAAPSTAMQEPLANLPAQADLRAHAPWNQPTGKGTQEPTDRDVGAVDAESDVNLTWNPRAEHDDE